jgi:O-antigen ligase
VQAAAVLAAAVAAAAALAVDRRAVRSAGLLAAPVFAAIALLMIVGDDVLDSLERRPALAAAAAAAALIGLLAAARVLRSRPAAFALLVLVALPFRVPVPIGGDTANLLVPLYCVIGVGALAAAFGWWRTGGDDLPDALAGRRVTRLRLTLAAVLVLYAVQALYTTDLDEATKNVCFFYVPFALLFRLLCDVPWSKTLLVVMFRVTVGLAVVFAAVGFIEYTTGELLISNEKVLETTELKGYFRVNSLFFDPNIYGRFLALTMVGLGAALLWSRRPRDLPFIAVALALLWAGMVLSLSQSSFGALLVGLAVIAALRWRARPVLAAVAGAAAIGALVVLFAGSSVGVNAGSDRGLDRATSGRWDLVTGGLRMARDRPVHGFGSGSFAERYRTRERPRSPNAAAISHTTPLTVAAEQGVIGLLAYAALLIAAFGVLFDGLARATRREEPGLAAVGGAAVAAAWCALLLHTFVYASFLEDPLAWVLLAVAAGLGPAWRAAAEEPAPARTEQAAAAGGRAPAPLPAT